MWSQRQKFFNLIFRPCSKQRKIRVDWRIIKYYNLYITKQSLLNNDSLIMCTIVKLKSLSYWNKDRKDLWPQRIEIINIIFIIKNAIFILKCLDISGRNILKRSKPLPVWSIRHGIQGFHKIWTSLLEFCRPEIWIYYKLRHFGYNTSVDHSS